MALFSGSSGIPTVQADPAPTLGGNLAVNGHQIIGATVALNATNQVDVQRAGFTYLQITPLQQAILQEPQGSFVLLDGDVTIDTIGSGGGFFATATTINLTAQLGSPVVLATTPAGTIQLQGPVDTYYTVKPHANNTLDLGSAALQFNTLYVGTDIKKGGFTILPETTNGDLAYYDGTKKVRLGIGTAGQVLTVSGGVPTWMAGTGTDEKVKISATDTTADYLTAKVVAGSTKLSKTVLNPGANEQISLDVVEANISRNALGGGVLTIGNGGTGQNSASAAFNALAPSLINGDLIYYNGSVHARLPIGSAGQVLTVSGGLPTWAAAGGGGSKYHQFHASLPGSASSTIGQLSKANSTTGNPGGLKPTTSSGDPGINNGGPDPFLAIAAMTIGRATLKVAHAAVGTGTFTSPATAKFDVYRLNYSTRTLLGTITFNVTNADVFNNLGSDRFAAYTATGLSIALAAGDAWGVEFRNEGSTNSQINALGGIWLSIEATE